MWRTTQRAIGHTRFSSRSRSDAGRLGNLCGGHRGYRHDESGGGRCHSGAHGYASPCSRPPCACVAAAATSAERPDAARTHANTDAIPGGGCTQSDAGANDGRCSSPGA
ncbi:hypothetical protein MASR1M101_19430 [Gemmatimonas sp.]